MKRKVAQYNKGQKLKVPREVRPFIEEMVAKREQYESEAFRQVGELFGLGAKDIGPDQNWMFAIDYEKNVAYSFDKNDPEQKRDKEIDKALVLDAIAKLEIAQTANPVIINILSKTMEDIEFYFWTLTPASMEVEITGIRPPADETKQFDLSSIENQGGVQ